MLDTILIMLLTLTLIFLVVGSYNQSAILVMSSAACSAIGFLLSLLRNDE